MDTKGAVEEIEKINAHDKGKLWWNWKDHHQLKNSSRRGKENLRSLKIPAKRKGRCLHQSRIRNRVSNKGVGNIKYQHEIWKGLCNSRLNLKLSKITIWQDYSWIQWKEEGC